MKSFIKIDVCNAEESRQSPCQLDMLVSSHFRWHINKNFKEKSIVKQRTGKAISLLMGPGRQLLKYLREDSIPDRLRSPFQKRKNLEIPEKAMGIPKEDINSDDDPVEYLSLEEMWARCSGYMMINPKNSVPEWKMPKPRLPRPPQIYCQDGSPELSDPQNTDDSHLSIDDFLKPPVCPPVESGIFQLPAYLEELRPGPALIEEESDEENLIRLYHLSFLKDNDLLCSPVELIDPEILQEHTPFVSRALKPGTILDKRFEILKVILEKRYGNTYLVLDKTITGRKMIIKETIPEPMDPEEYQERLNAFEDTIRILTRFKAPGMVEVYGSFHQNGREYYYMEKADGIDLEKLADMNASCFSLKEVMKWGVQICQAAEHLHNRPIPFTLGELLPRHIMVDETGDVRIVGFDLQRFFDKSSNLHFRPDNPRKLYGDITKIARVLYFLLTKQYFEKTQPDRQWPKPVPARLRRLLTVACRTDQQAYGSVSDFKELLINSILPEPSPQKKILEFPCRVPEKGILSNICKFIKAQKPMTLALVSLAVIFALLFQAFFHLQQNRKKNFVLPDGKMAWILAGDELMLFNPLDFSLIHSKPLTCRYSSIIKIPASPDVKDRENDGKAPVLVMSGEGASLAGIFDASTLSVLNKAQLPWGVTSLIYDDENRRIFALHRERGLFSRLEGELPEVVDVSATGNEPVNCILLKGFYPNTGEASSKGPAVAISSPQDGQIMIMSSENGRIAGVIPIEGKPGPMAYCPVRKKLYVAEISGPRILVINPQSMAVEKDFKIPGQNPTAIIICKSTYRLWVSMKDSNSVEVADPVFGHRRTIRGFGTKPANMGYDRNNGRIWVMNEGTKDLAILSEEDEKLLHRIDLGKTPKAAYFDY